MSKRVGKLATGKSVFGGLHAGTSLDGEKAVPLRLWNEVIKGRLPLTPRLTQGPSVQ